MAPVPPKNRGSTSVKTIEQSIRAHTIMGPTKPSGNYPMNPKERLYHKICLSGVKFDAEVAAEFAKIFPGFETQKDVVGFIGKYPIRTREVAGERLHVVVLRDVEESFHAELDEDRLWENGDLTNYVPRASFEEWHRQKVK